MNRQEKEALLHLISQNEIETALQQILRLTWPEKCKEQAHSISADYHQLREQAMKGFLTTEQKETSHTKIVNRLVALLQQCDEKPKTAKPNSPSTTAKLPFWRNKIVQSIGLIGSIASIIGLCLYFWPQPTENAQLTIHITDTKGNPVLENTGELHITLGNRSLNRNIGDDGRTNFGEIPNNLKGDSITIGLQAEGYEIADGNNIFLFEGKPIILKVKRDNSLGTIKGAVMDRKGQRFLENALVRINNDTSILTKKDGSFYIVLPERMQVKKTTDGYNLTVNKEGYETVKEKYYPKSSDADIRLVPLK